jgi:hypothetical protein
MERVEGNLKVFILERGMSGVGSFTIDMNSCP